MNCLFFRRHTDSLTCGSIPAPGDVSSAVVALPSLAWELPVFRVWALLWGTTMMDFERYDGRGSLPSISDSSMATFNSAILATRSIVEKLPLYDASFANKASIPMTTEPSVKRVASPYAIQSLSKA